VLRARPISKYSSVAGPMSKNMNRSGNGTSVILSILTERKEFINDKNSSDFTNKMAL